MYAWLVEWMGEWVVGDCDFTEISFEVRSCVLGNLVHVDMQSISGFGMANGGILCIHCCQRVKKRSKRWLVSNSLCCEDRKVIEAWKQTFVKAA